MEKIIDRFLRYISIDTASDPESNSQPSTNKQFVLLELLKKELEEMGISATLDQYGYVMASIPSNIGDKEIPALGFIAHVDTAPDAPGANIKPQIIENYNGEDITINEEKGIYLRVKDFPELPGYKGNTIITTDGTTLLGADDKAGVAEIMAAVEYIVTHPEFKHGDIKIGFTPDEEIGRGVDYFDVEKFGAKYAYTLDGGEIGELEYENFNAAGAKIHIQGCNIHPGFHIYIPIIEKHGYTFEQYQTSVDHYLHKPEILIKIFKEVEDRMKEREKELEIIVDREYRKNIRWSLLDSLDRCADKNLKGNSLYRALNLIFFEADTPKVTSPKIDSAILNHIISPYYLYDTVPTMYDSITLEEYILNKSFESKDTTLIKNKQSEKSPTLERGRFRKQTLIKKDFDR